jgi:hypothetical protein
MSSDPTGLVDIINRRRSLQSRQLENLAGRLVAMLQRQQRQQVTALTAQNRQRSVDTSSSDLLQDRIDSSSITIDTGLTEPGGELLMLRSHANCHASIIAARGGVRFNELSAASPPIAVNNPCSAPWRFMQIPGEITVTPPELHRCKTPLRHVAEQHGCKQSAFPQLNTHVFDAIATLIAKTVTFGARKLVL